MILKNFPEYQPNAKKSRKRSYRGGAADVSANSVITAYPQNRRGLRAHPPKLTEPFDLNNPATP